MAYSDDVTIKVQAPLSDARGEFDRRVDTLVQDLQDLTNKIDSLQAFWQGKSAADYQEFQFHWNRSWMDMIGPHGVLGAIATAMGVTWNNYSEAEFTNARVWTRG